jgi:serine phosphatase RsbU (regulator of sigma subunit)
LLGVLAEADLRDSERQLEPGDLVVLYTDGVTEARRGEDFLGDTGLADIIARRAPVSTARALVDSVLEEVLAFQYGDPRDDIAIVGIAVP